MAFPTTTTVDAFNRANENPLSDGGKWSAGVFTDLQVVSNACKATAIDGMRYRNDITPGPDCEVYCTVATKPGNGSYVAVYARLASAGSSGNEDGYEIEFDPAAGTDGWSIWREDNGGYTKLGASFSQELTAGDSFGGEIVSSTITLYYKPSAGAWTSLGTRTDSTYSAAGRIGLQIGDTTCVVDDFSGGTVTAGGGTSPITGYLRPWGIFG